MTTAAAPSVAIITMTQKRDFPYAWSCFRTLAPQLGGHRHHFILFNDDRDEELESALSERPHTTLLTPGENLGVARGRNRLIDAALSGDFDLVLSLDNDLLIPSDFVERISTLYSQMSKEFPPLGIIGPAVLDYHASEIHDSEETSIVERGGLSTFSSTESLRQQLVRRWGSELPLSVAYHFGIRGWSRHYLKGRGTNAVRIRSIVRVLNGDETAPVDAFGEIRVSDLRHSVLQQSSPPIPVDSLAGGVCAYSTELVRSIGHLEEAFSPFGYEDAEFAIRAAELGYSNFVLPSEILLHDLASRKKERGHEIAFTGIGKARALLARKQFDAARTPPRIAEALVGGSFQVASMIGFGKGGGPVEGAELASGIVRYFAGLVVGAFRPLSTRSTSTWPGDTRTGTWGRGSIRLGSSTMTYDSLTIRANEEGEEGGPPVRFDGDIAGCSLPVGSASPLSGLPPELQGSAGLTYEMDLASRELRVTRLLIDIPGLVKVDASCVLVGVGPGDPEPESDPGCAGIGSVSIRMHDRGFLGRTESTLAWARGVASNGMFGALAPEGRSSPADAIRSCLTSGEPGVFHLTIEPVNPVTVADLKVASANGTDVVALLGLSAHFEPFDSVSLNC